MYSKRRSEKYKYELENELVRLEIAKKSFRFILTPQEYKLNGNTLLTSKVGAGTSYDYKKIYSPMHFVDEYVNILNKLWEERLETELDLTPKWVEAPVLTSKTNLHPDFNNKSRADLAQILTKKPLCEDSEKRVVHGDLCPVNIIFNDNGQAIGLIDLGDLHIGDKMLDIAILSWTIRGNFGKKYEKLFLEQFNIGTDDERLNYYRLIYDLNLPDYKTWDWIKE